MKKQMTSPRDLFFSFILLLASTVSTVAHGDELISLDDPTPTITELAPANAAPAGEALESLDDSTAIAPATATSGDAEVALDLGVGPGGENFFNPYTFSRNQVWVVAPLLSMILLGLHLIAVPKRKSKQKIDQSQRFFRGISGDNTATGIEKMKLMAEKAPTKGGT